MYDESFGTDWESIDRREEVVERAYALGVATRLGETYSDELDRLTDQVATTYDQSFVDLAYQKGRDEAAGRAGDADTVVWEELVEEKTVIEAEESTDDVEDTLPDAIRGVDIETPPADSTESLRRPAFLDRQRADQSGDEDGAPTLFGDGRSVFGRSLARVRRTRDDGGDQEETTADDGESEDEAQSGQTASETDGDGRDRDQSSAQSATGTDGGGGRTSTNTRDGEE